nr:hypothetical protein [uncultured bacterium]
MKKQELMEQELIQRTESTGRQLRADIEQLGLAIPRIEPPKNEAAIVNLIDDGDYSWSTLAYTTPGTTPGTAGDDNQRAYNWYREQRATVVLATDNAHGLKSAAHSLFGAETDDTPRWDKTNGWAELGETGATPWDVIAPLPNNFATPGMRLRVQMITRLRTSTTLPGPLQFFWLIQDNTVANPGVLKGTAFVLDGAAFGTLGATSRSYKLIVDHDNGDQIESTIKTIANTPAVLSAMNGVALTWPRYPGFTKVTIYVQEGGVTSIAGFIGNGTNAFNDSGQRFGTVSGFPTATATQPRAYAEANPFVPTIDWQLWVFFIFVPQTYNFSLTTAQQMLRGGVIGPMGEGHQLQIDRIGVSTGDGVWSPSAHDSAVTSSPSTSQTSSQQGPPSSGSGDTAPSDGQGRLACSTLDTPIDICDEDGSNERKVELGEIDEKAVARGTWLVGKYDQPVKVKGVKIGWSELILTIQTENGAGRRCSPSDLWLLNNGPAAGIAARRLCEGMEVMTRRQNAVHASRIVKYSVSTQGEEIAILETHGETDDERIYWAGDAAAHNAKLLEAF